MDFTPLGYSVLPFALALAVFVALLAMLGLLMPFFVYQIRNDMRRTAQSLDALNLSITRALGNGSPRSAGDDVKGAASSANALESFPDEASIGAKALFHSVSRR